MRRNAWRARLTAAMIAAVIGVTSEAAAHSPARIALPDGRRVEVFGLRRWTLGMVQDSLAKYAPHDSLTSHACAAILRHKLGFADAGSWLFVFNGDTASQSTVAVREPQDSARVRFRTLAVDTVHPRHAWQVGTATLRTHPDAFIAVMQQRLGDTIRKRDPLRALDDVEAAAEFHRFLAAQRGARARDEALRVLSGSPNRDDRSLAVVILAGFPEFDAVWLGLIDAMRDPDDQVESLAADALDAMSRLRPRTVDWRPAAEGVHALLDGTAVFQFSRVVHVISRTGTGPRDAALLLRGGGSMLVDFLDSEHTYFSTRSRTLLTQLRGRDLGARPEAWRVWIDSL